AADTPCSTPITGIAGCCARAARGQAAAAPPSAASNSRRPMVTVMRPSRARCVREGYHAIGVLSLTARRKLLNGAFRNHCIEIVSGEKRTFLARPQLSGNKCLDLLRGRYTRLR